MQKILFHLILVFIISISCGTNEKSDKEKELKTLLNSIPKNGDGKMDSASASRFIELFDDLSSNNWKEIKSNEGNFRIEFPNFEVTEGQTTQLLDGEKLILNHYSINTQNEDHENLGYRMDYSFWPEIKTQEQIEEEFNIQRDYVLSATNATLEYENIIDSLDYPGRELYLTIDNSKIKARYRMYFDNGILYKLTVLTEDGNHFNKSITKFLNSFKTLDNVK